MDDTCEHTDICGRVALEGHDGKGILRAEKPDRGALAVGLRPRAERAFPS
jgi:hypothetical protein